MAPAVEHLRPERGLARPARWGFVALAAYNAVDAAAAAVWVRAAVWGVITAGLLALQLRPLRAGTRVEAAGVRAGSTWRWGRLVAWGDVEQVRVQGPYDDASRLLVRGRRPGRRPWVRLPGMSADDVRALTAAHGLPVHDPAGARRAASSSLPSGDAAPAAGSGEAGMEGPFRRSGTRPPRGAAP